MGEDTVPEGAASDVPEITSNNDNAEGIEKLEKARHWLFDDDFVRDQVQTELKDVENSPQRELLDNALRMQIDPETGLFLDDLRAVRAYDEVVDALMPGAKPYVPNLSDRAVAAWGNRTGADYARDFVDVANELGISLDDIAALNPAANPNGSRLELYRFAFPIVEQMVAKRGYTVTAKYNSTKQ